MCFNVFRTLINNDDFFSTYHLIHVGNSGGAGISYRYKKYKKTEEKKRLDL